MIKPTSVVVNILQSMHMLTPLYSQSYRRILYKDSISQAQSSLSIQRSQSNDNLKLATYELQNVKTSNLIKVSLIHSNLDYPE